MSYLQLSLIAPVRRDETLEELLTEAGALAVSFTPVGERSVIESAFGISDDPGDRIRITGLFDPSTDPESIRIALEKALPGEIQDWKAERLADRDWVRAWMDHFRPMRFGGRLWICPSGFDPPDDPEAVAVFLDPGLAFGTGTHPTTALCLEWLDAADLRGKRVVDYGCGSGVLAVAAAKLGATEVPAVDVDPAAVEAARENVRRNGVADRVRVGLPDAGATLLESGEEERPKGSPGFHPVDILLANILSGTLIDLAPRLAERVRPGGVVVLSGILNEQVEGVVRAYVPWFDMFPPVIREGWVLLEGKRR